MPNWVGFLYSINDWLVFYSPPTMHSLAREPLSPVMLKRIWYETRRSSPVDCRASTAEPPPIGKIHSFRKLPTFLNRYCNFDALQDVESQFFVK